jgi:hypothetical protein
MVDLTPPRHIQTLPQIEGARIAAIAIKPALTRVENREQLRRLMWGLRAGNPGI